MSAAAAGGPGVVVIGTDAEAVADRLAAMRAAGCRAAGFVGDDAVAAGEMAQELFGPDARVEPA